MTSASKNPLDMIRQGFCPACDTEHPILQCNNDSITLNCGHTIGLPLSTPIILRGRADGVAVIYIDSSDLLRVRQRESRGSLQ
jgi:hypothetical protein